MFSAQPTSDIWIWTLALLGAVSVFGAVVWIVRRKMFAIGDASGGEAWTLQQLRDLRADGQITEEEFQTLRSEMVGPHAMLTERKDGRSAGERQFERDGE